MRKLLEITIPPLTRASLAAWAFGIFASFAAFAENDPDWSFKKTQKEAEILSAAVERSKDPQEIRRLKFELLRKISTFEDRDPVDRLCRELKLQKEELHQRFICADNTTSNYMTIEERIREMQDIAEAAKKIKSNELSMYAMSSLGFFTTQNGDFIESAEYFQEALRFVQPGDFYTSFKFETDIAVAYYSHGDQHYFEKGTNMLKSKILEGMQYLDQNEVKPDLRQSVESFIAVANFNLGIALFIHGRQYAESIPYFEASAQIRGDFAFDALTFAAVAQAALGQGQAARLALKNSGKLPDDPIVSAYVDCYRRLTLHLLGDKIDLNPCLNLHAATSQEVQTDVFYWLNRVQDPGIRQKNLDNFYNYYEEKLLPQMKSKNSKAASRIELMRLELESKRKDLELEQSRTLRILAIGSIVLFAMALIMLVIVFRSRNVIREKQDRLSEQHRDLVQILNLIDEGIVKLDRTGLVTTIYSETSRQLLGSDLVGLTLEQLLSRIGLTSDTLQSTHAALQACLNEGKLAWQLNEGQLPQEVVIGGKPYLLSWQPVFLEDSLNEVLMTIRDASVLYQIREKEQTAERIMTLARVGSLGRPFLQFLLAACERWKQTDDLSTLLKEAHTFKGEARSLGFTVLKDALHELESACKKNQESMREAPLLILVDEVHALLRLQDEVFSGGQDGIQNDLLVQVVRYLQDGEKRLQKIGLPLSITISGDWFAFPREAVTEMKSILLHGIANAIDHGYVRPARERPAHFQEARLFLHAQSSPSKNMMEIRDEGMGIDWKTLRLKAAARGLPADASPAEMIFAEGLSTVSEEHISESSGRGLGTSVIQSAADKLGAEITIESSPDHPGTTMRVSWAVRELKRDQ